MATLLRSMIRALKGARQNPDQSPRPCGRVDMGQDARLVNRRAASRNSLGEQPIHRQAARSATTEFEQRRPDRGDAHAA